MSGLIAFSFHKDDYRYISIFLYYRYVSNKKRTGYNFHQVLQNG